MFAPKKDQSTLNFEQVNQQRKKDIFQKTLILKKDIELIDSINVEIENYNSDLVLAGGKRGFGFSFLCIDCGFSKGVCTCKNK
jgi:hypothetical protein